MKREGKWKCLLWRMKDEEVDGETQQRFTFSEWMNYSRYNLYYFLRISTGSKSEHREGCAAVGKLKLFHEHEQDQDWTGWCWVAFVLWYGYDCINIKLLKHNRFFIQFFSINIVTKYQFTWRLSKRRYFKTAFDIVLYRQSKLYRQSFRAEYQWIYL